MCRRLSYFSTLALLVSSVIGPRLVAQQTNVQTPFNSAGHSFYEQVGSSWGLNGPGWFFRFGGGPAAPPFGGAQPGAGIAGGAGFGGGGVNGGLNIFASQGARTSNVSQSGILTLYDGSPGFLSDASQSPFVTGFIPVVGQGKAPWRMQWEGDVPTQQADSAPRQSAPEAPSTQRAASTSPREDAGRLSLQEIERQRSSSQSQQEQETLQFVEKARQAVASGKPGLARTYFRLAMQRSEGELKARIAAELKALDR